jgi:hypothetical protein
MRAWLRRLFGDKVPDEHLLPLPTEGKPALQRADVSLRSGHPEDALACAEIAQRHPRLRKLGQTYELEARLAMGQKPAQRWVEIANEWSQSAVGFLTWQRLLKLREATGAELDARVSEAIDRAGAKFEDGDLMIDQRDAGRSTGP